MSYSQQAREKASEIASQASDKNKQTTDAGHKMSATSGDQRPVTGQHPATIGEHKTATGSSSETAQEMAQKASETISSAAEHAKQMVTPTKGGVGGTVDSAKQTASTAAQYTSQKMKRTRSWLENHPYKFAMAAMTIGFVLFGTMSAVPLLGMFGITATGQGLLSRMVWGKYDTFSYPANSVEANAHRMVDRALQSYMHQQRQSKFTTMLESLGLKSGPQMPSGMTSQMMQQLMSMYAQQQQPSEHHYLPGSLYSMLPGTSRPQEQGTDMSDIISKMMKGGMMTKGAKGLYESAPSTSSSWFGKKKQQPEHEYDTSMFSNIFGGQQQPELTHQKKGFLSGLTDKLSGTAKNVASYTGLTESEEEELKRLINQAAEKANRAL